MINTMRALAAVAVVASASVVASGTAAAQTSAVSVTNPTYYSADGPWVLGFNFTATSALSVSALGAFDFGGNGFADTHQVGLWNSSGTLLASVDLGRSASTLIYGFRYVSITPLSLIAGQSYTVGASNFGVNDDYILNGTIATASGIQYNGSRFAATSVFANPTSTGDVNGYFGANLRVSAEDGAVPEPATWAMMIAGFGVVGGALRRRSVKFATA